MLLTVSLIHGKSFSHLHKSVVKETENAFYGHIYLDEPVTIVLSTKQNSSAQNKQNTYLYVLMGMLKTSRTQTFIFYIYYRTKRCLNLNHNHSGVKNMSVYVVLLAFWVPFLTWKKKMMKICILCLFLSHKALP